MNTERIVLTFGSFDPLHEGHVRMLREARSHGSHLTVIVARDSEIRAVKQHEPHESQDDRLRHVSALPHVDEVRLGMEHPHNYELLTELEFDVLALGYDQSPSDDEVRSLLAKANKSHVEVVRLSAHKPDQYKSSKFRQDS